MKNLVGYIKSLSKWKKCSALAVMAIITVSLATFALARPATVQPSTATIDKQHTETQSETDPATQTQADVQSANSQDSPVTATNTSAPTSTNQTPTSKPRHDNSTALPPATVGPLPSGPPTIGWAAFMNPRVFCDNGAQIAAIQNMRVYASNVPAEGLTITWKWESSLPSLQYDIDNLVRTSTIPSNPYLLVLPDAQVFPYLYRASNWDAGSFAGGVIPAHSVRIHILTPNSVYTDWFAIPEFSTTVHPCS